MKGQRNVLCPSIVQVKPSAAGMDSGYMLNQKKINDQSGVETMKKKCIRLKNKS
jgi:hypothetical protein